MALLFSFASCDNGSTSSPSEKNPEIVAEYDLNGDKIHLYDDMTFTISLKNDAGTISGTYANASGYMTLLVGKKSGNVANVGNILKLKVADDKIEVISSDIDRYAEGEKGEQTGGSQNPGDISNPSETKPTVVATYGLKGDEISLYNDKTFTISLKDSTSKISGLYASVSGYMTLLVDKESVNLAKSGDVLKLKVAEDGKIEVISSDIDRYVEGDNGEQTGGTQNPGDADDPLGEPPAENLRLPKDYYSAIPCDDGIYFEFSVPNGARGGNACTVCIEGIGQVAEVITLNKNGNKGIFFYPFVKPDTKYTVRFTFPRQEDTDDDGFVIDYISDGTVGWFETTAIAGKNSLGEVKLTEKGAIEDKDINTNGDFCFTTKPMFEHKELLKGNWFVNIGLVEGVSWEHEGRKTKWSGEMNIPSTELSNTFNLYTYDENGTWRNNNLVIDFLCFRPRMYYEYNDNKYLYQWDGVTKDTPQLGSEARLWQTIDKVADVAKLKGTWIQKSEYDEQRYGNSYQVVYNETLTINTTNVKKSQLWTYTNSDGSDFTKEKLLKDRDFYSYTNYHGKDNNGIAASEVEEFEKTLNNEPRVLKFEKFSYGYGKDDTSESEMEETFYYRIYYLDSNMTLSDNKNILTRKYEYESESLSSLFEDREDSDGEVIKYYIKLFEDGSILQVTESRKYPYEEEHIYRTDYKKQ